MSDRPRFTPAAPPTIEWNGQTRIDTANEPACTVCGAKGPLDGGLCLADWRFVVLLPWALRANDEPKEGETNPLAVFRRAREELRRHGVHIDAKAYFADEGYPMVDDAPIADLTQAREAREVPRLIDAAGPAGVSLEVALEPPSNLGKPRRRP